MESIKEFLQIVENEIDKYVFTEYIGSDLYQTVSKIKIHSKNQADYIKKLKKYYKSRGWKNMKTRKFICDCGTKIKLELVGGQYQSSWQGKCNKCKKVWELNELSEELNKNRR